MPKRGYEYVRLEPIDSEHTLKEEMSRVKNTLEFEAAERLILAAQYRDRTMPLIHAPHFSYQISNITRAGGLGQLAAISPLLFRRFWSTLACDNNQKIGSLVPIRLP